MAPRGRDDPWDPEESAIVAVASFNSPHRLSLHARLALLSIRSIFALCKELRLVLQKHSSPSVHEDQAGRLLPSCQLDQVVQEDR